MIEEHIKKILKEIGEDINRTGLKDTPKRVAKMYKELFKGYNPDKKPKVTIFKNGEDGIVYNQMIIDTGKFYSFCEHHMLPFYGDYYFGYIPSATGNILGISKIARVIDYFSSKLQVQERLGEEIVQYLWKGLSTDGLYYFPKGMILVLKAKHLCKCMRGIKNDGIMTTSTLLGIFEKPEVRQEFFQLIK